MDSKTEDLERSNDYAVTLHEDLHTDTKAEKQTRDKEKKKLQKPASSKVASTAKQPNQKTNSKVSEKTNAANVTKSKVNIGILIAVTRIISRISADNYKVHRDANAFKLTAKAVAVLLPILGSSWIFGVLAVNEQSIVFQYMFAVFNSLQGFFIFLFHCLLNSEVRAAFKHKTKVWSLTSSSIRNINVKPFNSDVMNGNRANTSPTKMNTWDKSSNSANRIDLSAV